MRIIDPRDKKIYEIQNLKVVHHQMPDKFGQEQSVKCVEYRVIGKNHEWDFWCLYEDFIQANPELEI